MTFEELKRKADELKTRRDQALGAMKGIEDEWERKYGTRDPKEVKAKLDAMKAELDELNKEYDQKMAEAEAILEGK